MKKIILKIFFVAIVVLAAGFNVYNSQKNKLVLSDLLLANVEALAIGEGGDGENSEGSSGSLQLECDKYSIVIKCEKACSSCYKIWTAIGGYGNPGKFKGTCTCGKTY